MHLTYPTERAVYHVWEDGVEKETIWEFVDQQAPPHVAGVGWDHVPVPKCRRVPIDGQ
jgi:hypothetical protein